MAYFCDSIASLAKIDEYVLKILIFLKTFFFFLVCVMLYFAFEDA